MKTWIKYLHIVILYVVFTTLTYAQPSNDACAAAIPITVGVGSCNSTLYTNVAATTSGDPATPACWSPNSLSHSVWFSFVATTADIEISTNFAGTLANTQLAVYSGACGSLTQIACQEDINTAGSLFHTDVILHGLTIGNTYYMLVDGNGNTTGTFGICAQESLPVGPALPTQDCTGAQTLCALGNVSVANGAGGVGSTIELPSCFGSPGERSSNWYTFTAATSGTLAFTVTPTSVIDYDFAVYNTSASCPGTELVCNWDAATGATGTTGLGCAGIQCEPTIAVTAGQTYTILIDRYTSTSSAGFALNFAGTTATFGSPNPTFTATKACLGSATQFTNTTNGNFTYNWNFGDGFTSNSANPTHTYTTSGSHSVTLLLTANPGGCQNAITQSVTVTPIPTVDAGIGGTVCSGGCITLGGSTNAVGGVTGPVSFTNTNDYNIPDNSPVGVYSPIVVSGISPTIIGAGSIVSVCIDIYHDFDDDVDMYLQCPDGTRLELSTDNGGSNFDYTNTCFSPTASTSITTGTAPFTGTWLPEQSFNVLNGCTTNGTWQLFVQDDSALDTGHIMDWTITFNNSQPAYTWSPTTAMTNATTLAPTVCPTTATTYTLTASNGIGCTAADTVTINVNPAPTATISYAGTPFCSSIAATQGITLTGTGAYTGGVYSAPAGLSINAASGAITPSTSTPNTYTVTYTIAASAGCAAVTVITSININTILTPTINCGVSTTTAVQFTWGAVAGATGYNASYQVNANPVVNSGAIGNVLNYTINSLTPGDSVTITLTPTGGAGTCFTLNTATCTAANCNPPNATISYAGTPFCSSVAATQGITLTGTGAYTGGIYSAPAGLSINAASGAITPSTSTPNTYTVTYTIAVSAGCAAVTAITSITITPLLVTTFNPVSPICSSSPLSALPTISNEGVTGTWSPALNNTSTTNYHFTPTAGLCANGSNLTIIVYSLPQVTTVSPLYYCDPNNDGFGVFDLTQVIPTIIGGTPYPISFHETLTDAEINGTYIPNPSNYSNIHVSHQTIYIRVESTESSSCYKIITLELIVNPTPEATEPDDYHVCDTDNDGFASFDLTTAASQVFGSINQSTHTIAYYTSQTDAQLATNPIGNLTSFINQIINTQTIWIRVTNSATGCYDIGTLQLFVDPLPSAAQPNYPQYTLCDIHAPLSYEEFDLGSKITDILMGQTGMNVTFHFSQADALAAINSLPLLYTNVAPNVQTVWIRVENAITGCFVLSTMDIRVEPLPSPIPPSEPYTICDGNQDGFGTFNLNTLTTDILQGANYTITYHETIEDAQLGNNPLVSPYDNITPFFQIIYASAIDNINGCRSIIPIELNVDPQPITPFTVPNLIQCDEDSNPQNLSMVFDLTQNNSAVLTIQPLPASNYTVTYYISETDANAGIAPIIPSTNYVGANHEIIWVRVENNNSNCYSIGSFELLINPPLALTTPTPLSICDSDTIPNDQYTIFDLTFKNNEITGGFPNMTVTYYPSYPVTSSSVAIPNPSFYANILPAVQTLGVMVTNAQGCRSYISLDIRVLPIPTPRNTGIRPLPAQCDINDPGDMLETFNLTLNASIIINGDPTLVLHYYSTQVDALAATNEIMNPTAALVGHNVWIRVENNRVDYLGYRCFVLVEQPLTVNPLPPTIPVTTVQNCDDDTDGQAPFNLTTTTSSFYGDSDYTITYYTSAANAQSATNAILNPTNFTNSTNPQIIYIRVVNNATGCVNYNGQFTITVNPKPTATAPAAFETCDVDGTNDGFLMLDLSTYINGIIGAQTGVINTFYDTQTDAVNGTNAISNLTNYQAYTHTVWVRVENAITGCYQLVPLNITVEQLAEPIISSPRDTICVEYATNVLLSGLALDSGITSPNYTFTWSLGGVVIPGATDSTYNINTVAPGDYIVVATSTSSLGCMSNVSNTFNVIQSGPALVSEPPYTVSNAFDDNQIITINVVGFGVYEYSLDDGPFQSSNIFEYASLGEHTITIRDVKGNTSCGEIVIDGVQTIDYPHYFTPNGDGYHDTWNVIGLENQHYAKLYIFDRYGKLLKQLSTDSDGWDGTYNDHLLPADDYWFKVEYTEQTQWKEFKSHFTLKR